MDAFKYTVTSFPFLKLFCYKFFCTQNVEGFGYIATVQKKTKRKTLITLLETNHFFLFFDS